MQLSDLKVGSRIRTLSDIVGDDVGCHPSSRVAKEGDELIVRTIYGGSFAVSHEGDENSSFIMFLSDRFELI